MAAALKPSSSLQLQVYFFCPIFFINKKLSTCDIICIVATLGALAMGTVLGWSSPSQEAILAGDVFEFEVTLDDFQWVGSAVVLGAALSCLPAGLLVDWIGRKYTMLFISIPFVIGKDMFYYFDSIKY